MRILIILLILSKELYSYALYKTIPDDSVYPVEPYDVAVDEEGYIYLLDRRANNIKKYDHDGNFIKYFATLNKPTSIFISKDFIYVSDTGNKEIKIYSKEGHIQKSITNNEFGTLTGILATQSYIFVCDIKNNKIYKINKDTQNIEITSQTVLNEPYDITCSNNILYVSDSLNQRIALFDLSLNLKGSITIPYQGVYPKGIAVDENNDIYILQASGEYGLLKLSKEGIIINKSTQTIGYGLVLGQGLIYVANHDKSCVDVFDRDLQHKRFIAKNPKFDTPHAVAIFDNVLYILDKNKLKIFNLLGNLIKEMTISEYNALGPFSTDKSGNLYIVDNLKKKIKRYNSKLELFEEYNLVSVNDRVIDIGILNNNIYILTPQELLVYNTNKTSFESISKIFSDAKGMVTDSEYIYVSDNHLKRIFKLTNIGSITNEFVLEESPFRISIDKYGSLYFIDGSSNKIKKLSKEGNISTILGTFTSSSDLDIDKDLFIYVISPDEKKLFIYKPTNMEIYKVSPDKAYNRGSITLTIIGINFEEGIKTYLKKDNHIVEGVVLSLSKETIIAEFSVDGRDLGFWDIVIELGSLTFNYYRGIELIKTPSPLYTYSFPKTAVISTYTTIYIYGRDLLDIEAVFLNQKEVKIENASIIQGSKTIKAVFDTYGYKYGLYDLILKTKTQEIIINNAIYLIEPAREKDIGWIAEEIKTIDSDLTAMASADINLDKILEIYYGEPNGLYILEGNNTSLISQYLTNIRCITTGDADNDNKNELYLGDGKDLYKIFYTNGYWESNWIGNVDGYINSLVIGDVDLDGVYELYCLDETRLYKIIYDGRNWQKYEVYKFSDRKTKFPFVIFNHKLKIADCDNDANLELYILTGGDLYQYKKTESGIELKELYKDKGISDFDIADIDTDGIEELYFTSQDGLYKIKMINNEFINTSLLNLNLSNTLINIADIYADNIPEIYLLNEGKIISYEERLDSQGTKNIFSLPQEEGLFITSDIKNIGKLGLYIASGKNIYSLMLHKQDFKLNISTDKATVSIGSIINFELRLDPIAGFNKEIKLSQEGLPSSITYSFSKNNITPPATLTLAIIIPDDKSLIGTYNVKITAVSEAGDLETHYIYFDLVVQDRPDFEIFISPSQRGIKCTDIATFTVSLRTNTAFQGSITLSINQDNDILNYMFLPTNVLYLEKSSYQEVTLYISTKDIYKHTITTTFYILGMNELTPTKTVSATLTIYPPPDFIMNVEPLSKTINIDKYATYTIEFKSFDFNGVISVKILSTPTTILLSPQSFSFELEEKQSTHTTISAKPQNIGTYTIYILSYNEILGTKSSFLKLYVLPTATFSLQISPTYATVNQMSSATFYIDIMPLYNFSEPIELYIDNLPEGLKYNYNKEYKTLYIYVCRDCKTGSYTIFIIGSSTTTRTSTTFSIYVIPPAYFDISCKDYIITLDNGASTNSRLYLYPYNYFFGTISLSVNLGTLSGALLEFNEREVYLGYDTTKTISFLLKTSPQTELGTYTISILANSDKYSTSTEILLIITNIPPLLLDPKVIPEFGTVSQKILYKYQVRYKDTEAPSIRKIYLQDKDYDLYYSEGRYDDGALYEWGNLKIDNFPANTLTYRFVFSDGYASVTSQGIGPLILRCEVFHGLIHSDYIDLIVECSHSPDEEITYQVTEIENGTLTKTANKIFSKNVYISGEGEFSAIFYYKKSLLDKIGFKVKTMSNLEDIISYKNTTLIFKKGCIDYPTKISILEIANNIKLPNNLELLSQIYRLGPYNKRLNKEAVIKIKYKISKPIDIRKIAIYRISSEGFKHLQTEIIDKENIASAKIIELGNFAVIYNPFLKIQEETPKINSVYTYPNPCLIKKNKILKIRVETTSEIEPENIILSVYNLDGELVAELKDFSFAGKSVDNSCIYIKEWDLRNRYNTEISSGVYLYMIKIKKKGEIIDKKIGKFTIIK